MKAKNKYGSLDVVGYFSGSDADGKCRSTAPDEFRNFQHFNGGPHIALNVKGSATISVNIGNGQQVTMAFVAGRDDDNPECIDVKVSGATSIDNGDGRTLDAHHVMGFHGGRGQIDSRRVGPEKEAKPVSLTAILLNKEYYG
jgi:hypothetical protein